MKDLPSTPSTDYWFKVVDFLQQNWAVIDPSEHGCSVYFFSDTAGVFDQIEFNAINEAQQALIRNDFARYDHDKSAQEIIAKPEPPFWWGGHPNGNIYSSGRFWK